MFDGVCVVSLDRAPERWAQIERVAAAGGLGPLTRVPGVDGRALDAAALTALQREGRVAADLGGFHADARAAEIGCGLGHALALQTILERGWQTALVLEDDVALAGDPHSWPARCAAAFADLPDDWDVWYLYRCFDIAHRSTRLTARTVIPYTPQGGAAYAVTRRGAERMLAAITPLARPVDASYAALVQRGALRAFAASPLLIDPGTMPSLINTARVRRDWVVDGVNRPPEYWPLAQLAHLGERAPRILQVAWGFEPFGGMERHITELSLALQAEGLDVEVLLETPAPDSNAYVRRLRSHGVPVSGAGWLAGALDRLGTVLRARQARARGRAAASATAPATPTAPAVPGPRRAHPVTRDLFRRLAAAVARGRPDAIHVHGTRLRQAWVIDWAHARGIPTVYTEHVTLDERAGAVDAAAIATMRERLGAMACVSERSRASLQATLGAGHPVAVMRHVVDGPADEQLQSSTTEEGVDAQRPLAIVCVARLEHYKGIDVLLRALALVQSRGAAVAVRILGDGTERAALEALARSLDLRHVEFSGAVPPETVSQALLAADLMVLPSRGEGLPLAIVEAMAHGRPVLATRVGGNAEVVVDGVTGLLVEPERAEALADALVELAASRERLQAMGAAARRAWADGAWSPIHVVAQARALYAKAASRSPGATAR